MNQSQKAVKVFLEHSSLRIFNSRKLSEKYGVDKRLLSYLASLKAITSIEEFSKICKNIGDGRPVSVASGESTKSLECLLKIIRKTGSSIVLGEEVQATMVVYILTSNDKTKIGIAKSITNRVKLLQTGNPYPLILEAVHSTTEAEAREFEKELHLKYDAYRCIGEWFHLPDTCKAELISIVHTKGLDDGK